MEERPLLTCMDMECGWRGTTWLFEDFGGLENFCCYSIAQLILVDTSRLVVLGRNFGISRKGIAIPMVNIY